MKLRPDTWDAFIASSVIANNEYGLPPDMTGSVVVDIGAHIGSFAVACQNRNAAVVFSIEPDKENYALLEYNVGCNKDSKTVTNIMNAAAVGSVEQTGRVGVRHLSEHDFDRGRNTGHVDVFGAPDDTQVIPITDLLDIVTTDYGKVDLLKIDCEGFEHFILPDADLSKVGAIMAEIHALPKDSGSELLKDFADADFTTLAQRLKFALQDKGFSVNIIETVPGVLGKLTAARPHKAENPKFGIPRVLWIGDGGVNTGFGKVTDNVCRRLVDKGWDVRVLGVGYNGDPHSYPYLMYPAVDGRLGGHPKGYQRLQELVRRVEPDVVVLSDDNWNVGLMADQMAMLNISAPTIGYVAVDSENVRPDVAMQLKNLRHVVCHTEFGVEQLNKAGYHGPISSSPHGVNHTLYTPQDRKAAREGIADVGKNHNLTDAFIWGSVAMSQQRKRIDLTVYYFAKWWERAGKPDNAYLYLHTHTSGAWNIKQLTEFLGIRGRVLATQGGSLSLNEEQMPMLYSAIDCMLSTSECESFGLPHLESMSCGVPQIAMEFSGLRSWAEDSIYWVEKGTPHFLEDQINALRYTVPEEPFVQAMTDMYSKPELREEYRNRGLAHAAKFSWDDLATHIDNVMRQTIAVKNAATVEDALADFS